MNQIREVAPGFWLITLPLPFELNHVNVGLVRTADGWLLIDTGMSGTKSFAALENALREIAVRWVQIRTVVATHIHPDHIGSAPRVIEASGAKFLIHHAEFEYLQSILAGETPWVDSAFVAGGVPREQWDGIRNSLRGMRGALPDFRPDQLLRGDEAISTALGTARIVPTPGHSSGHICLYWPERKLLYAGDHMIEKITPNIAWMPGRDMLGEYLDSLSAVEGMDVELVVSSHGEPFAGHREWIAATRHHHDQRCSEILAHLDRTPRTAAELVPALWNRDFSEFHFYFALFEVLAHLEYMERQGTIRFSMAEDGAKRWFVTGSASAAAGLVR